jgi:hypothetical protein
VAVAALRRRGRRLCRLADTHLSRCLASEWGALEVAKAFDKSQASSFEKERKLLRKEAADLDGTDDKVRLTLGREVPNPARDLRRSVIALLDVDADLTTLGVSEALLLAAQTIGASQDLHTRVEDIEGEPSARRQVSAHGKKAVHDVACGVQMS